SSVAAAAEVKVDVCCTSGYEWASLNEDCASLPTISESKQCRLIQEQCCLNQLEEFHCTAGINIAAEKNSCDTSGQENSSRCETRFVQRCCSCCLLGKEAQARGETCEQSMFLGYQCSLVFRACCMKGNEGNDTPNQDEANNSLVTNTDNEDPSLNDRCRDIDECTSGTHNCLPTFNCQNTPGSFRCRPKVQCSTGFIQDALGNCIDINECLSINAPCPQGQTCINTEGSYTCQRHVVNCGRGYHLSADGTKCEDVDECASNPCSQECANVYGSYQCYCRRGYQLSDVDGITCEDIDECALPTGGHICSYRCNNVPGSFRCTCPLTGYTLAPNGRNCQDVDECVTGTHNCSGSETCFNIQGGFKCLLFECPKNYRKAIETRCERLPCFDTECQSQPLRITYHQLSFPTNIPVPTDIFRMGPSHALPGDNIQLSITSGNEKGYFVTKNVNSHSGLVAVQQPITEPQDFLLTIQMDLIRHGTLNTFIAKLYVFVTAEL
ncbi:hypothetical protein GDO78_006572, partial [Eleutherodactylus coqui]